MNQTHPNPAELLSQKLAEQKADDKLGRLAAATPLPGPVAEALLAKNIPVANWKVRPFYDIDFEFLKEIDHPLQYLALGDDSRLEKFAPRGPDAWVLFQILTTDVEWVEAILSTPSGKKDLAAEARKNFGILQFGQLLALYQAAVQQITTYASTMVGHQPASEGTEDAKASGPFPSSETPSTGAAGSSRSDVG